MQPIFRSILSLLDRSERRAYWFLIAAALAMALVDVVSVAAVLPFLAVVANPMLIRHRAVFAWLQSVVGGDEHRFLIVLGLVVFVVVIGGIACRAVTFHYLTRFSRMRGYTISMRLFRNYLGRSYLWHVEQQSADLGRKVLDEVREVVNGPLVASMRLVANLAAALLLSLLLVALEPLAALAAAGLMGVCYGVVFMLIQRRLTELGDRWQHGNAQRYRIMQEALSGIREVKLFGLTSFYLNRYSHSAWEVARTIARIATISELPRHVLEAVAFGGMLLFLIVLLGMHNGRIEDVVPVLGAYAFAGVRLFPLVQQVYRDYTVVRTGEQMIASLTVDLAASLPPALSANDTKTPISFERELRLDKVTFAYPGSDSPALNECDLSVKHGTMVGLVGLTGAGKSTLIDVMLGLIAPDTGSVEIDGRPLDATSISGWQRQIGYVPQSIFLTSGSIAENIAFGETVADIDQDRVAEAARAAQIDTFVDSLPAGYRTPVGERGARLSGGQRQRVAIARALYRQPSFLVFDEATSALDAFTETRVMRAIEALSGEKTVMLISHRLSSLQRCDRIHILEGGRIAASGSFDELSRTRADFLALRNAG